MARRLRREREGGAADETPQKEESAKKKKKSVYDLSPESENTTEVEKKVNSSERKNDRFFFLEIQKAFS